MIFLDAETRRKVTENRRLARNSVIDKSKTIEIYTHDIYIWVDEFINNELNISIDDFDNIIDYRKYICDNRMSLFLYISRNIGNIDKDNIDLLNGLFNIYINICSKYNIMPTLEVFGMMINIDSTTFTDWSNNEYRNTSLLYSQTVKMWKNRCKMFVLDRLSNQTGTNANLIFIAKAAYGMVETAPQMLTNTEQQISRQTIEEIRERHALTMTEPPPEIWTE